MNKLFVICFKASVDDQFAERFFNEDAFEFWNRCVVEGTARGEFPTVEGEPNKIAPMPHCLQVRYEKRADATFNYEVTYYVKVGRHDGGRGNNIVSALFLLHGAENVYYMTSEKLTYQIDRELFKYEA